MTTTALKVHPKVYWIWNHRRWCLEHIPEKPDPADIQAWRRSTWERELFIVERMLDADSRNCPSFHSCRISSGPSDSLSVLVMAWDYRRYVLASMPIRRPEKAELAYTTKKIEANFSNFSAWHQRTKVLSSLWASGEVDRKSSLQKGINLLPFHRRQVHQHLPQSEFELVQNAMFTLPEDQSAWLYHRWLIGSGWCSYCVSRIGLTIVLGDDRATLEREVDVIQTLLDEQPDSKCEH
jgi:geranylgeranyl transferase type-2 subunit alpha